MPNELLRLSDFAPDDGLASAWRLLADELTEATRLAREMARALNEIAYTYRCRTGRDLFADVAAAERRRDTELKIRCDKIRRWIAENYDAIRSGRPRPKEP